MTTILGFKNNMGFFMGSDNQVTCNGHLRNPDSFEKIIVVENSILVASTGEVGFSQQVLEQVRKDLKISKVMEDSNKPINIGEVARELAHKNFYFPLLYRRFTPNDFLCAGVSEDGDVKGFSIGSDGSSLEVKSYVAGGSGGEIALSILSLGYDENLSVEDSTGLVQKALENASKNDVFTNKTFSIYSITLNEEDVWILRKWVLPEQVKEEIKPTAEEVEVKK